MDTLLCNDDGDIVIGTYQPSNTLLSLSADQYTAGSATWSDQSGNGLDFTVSTNASLKGTDANGFPYMNFGGSYGIAKRIVSSALTNITAPTTGKYTIFCVTQILNSTSTWRTLVRGSGGDHQVIIGSGNNNLGLYDSSGSNFLDSGFDITTAMTNSRNLLVWELSTSSPIYNFQLNESGTNSTITSATNYTLPFCCIGGYHNNSTVITTSSQYWGNIYEFIVYDGVLSASERVYVAEYLTYKWGITSKLPSFTSTQGVIIAEFVSLTTLPILQGVSGAVTLTGVQEDTAKTFYNKDRGVLVASVAIDQNTQGIIYEGGGSSVGFVLYATGGTLYCQCGTSSVVAGSIELSWPIPSYFSTNISTEIGISAEVLTSTSRMRMFVNREEVGRTSTTKGISTGVAGSDIAGSGQIYNDFPVCRISSAQATYTDTIYTVNLYPNVFV